MKKICTCIYSSFNGSIINCLRRFCCRDHSS